MNNTRHFLALLIAAFALAACQTAATDGPYVPPTPVQLTPPDSVVWEADSQPFVRFHTDYQSTEIVVEGSAYRPIRIVRVDDVGRTRLELVKADDGSTVRLAEAGFHFGAVGATQSDGSMMLCWNTLTGDTSEYSPITPDPARGMALSCRQFRNGSLGTAVRIRSPTVGCWIRRLVAMPDGGFRLLYKGDDGWFEASENPQHGVYEAMFADAWSLPSLLIPVPNVSER